jgi:hypothetical protein
VAPGRAALPTFYVSVAILGRLFRNRCSPGKDPAEFEKLHRDLTAEFSPDGALEYRTVAEIARLVWRKENLATFHKAELVKERYRKELERLDLPEWEGSVAQNQAAREVVREKLGNDYALFEAGPAVELKRFIEDLDVEDRLDAKIDRCLKRLLFLKGLKSVSANSTSTPPRRLAGPAKAA